MTDSGWAKLCLKESAENARTAERSIRAKPGKFGRYHHEVADGYKAAAEAYEKALRAIAQAEAT